MDYSSCEVRRILSILRAPMSQLLHEPNHYFVPRQCGNVLTLLPELSEMPKLISEEPTPYPSTESTVANTRKRARQVRRRHPLTTHATGNAICGQGETPSSADTVVTFTSALRLELAASPNRRPRDTSAPLQDIHRHLNSTLSAHSLPLITAETPSA